MSITLTVTRRGADRDAWYADFSERAPSRREHDCRTGEL